MRSQFESKDSSCFLSSYYYYYYSNYCKAAFKWSDAIFYFIILIYSFLSSYSYINAGFSFSY